MKKVKTDISKPMIERLASVSADRSIADTPCDVIFSDVPLDDGDRAGRRLEIVDDPIRAALDHTKDNHDQTAMAVRHPYFMVVHWDPCWMRVLRLWDEDQRLRRMGGSERCRL